MSRKMLISVEVDRLSNTPIVSQWQVVVNNRIVAHGLSRVDDCCIESAGNALIHLVQSGLLVDVYNLYKE
jgi:hypothetical protein